MPQIKYLQVVTPRNIFTGLQLQVPACSQGAAQEFPACMDTMQIPRLSLQHWREKSGAPQHLFAGFCPAPSAHSSSLSGLRAPLGHWPLVPREMLTKTRDHLHLSSHPEVMDRPSANISTPHNPHPAYPAESPGYHQHHRMTARG